MSDDVVRLVTGSSEAETAADLKKRIGEAFLPILALMDEAASKGLMVRWDAVGPTPPFFRFAITGLRIEKHY